MKRQLANASKFQPAHTYMRGNLAKVMEGLNFFS